MPKDEKILTQEQLNISLYETKTIYDTFRNTLEWAEKFIERAGYYDDWNQRKQIHDNQIQRSDINYIDLEEIKNLFSTVLFGLRHMTRIKPSFLIKELGLEEKFYKWIDATGINADNCPSELAQCLVNISEVLKGRGDEFAEERIRQADENIEKMSEEERVEKLQKAVIAYQEPLENEVAKAKFLEGKIYKDFNFESKFSGDCEQGKEVFNQIVRKIKGHQQLSGYLLENGDALINGEEYEPVKGEIQATQEQIDNAKQKQQELAQNRSDEQKWVKVGVAGGFVALITAFGIKIFGKSLR